MKTTFKVTLINIIACSVLVVFLLSVSSVARAQRSFSASFGVHSVKAGSNISQIDRALINVAGGQIGVVFGEKVFRYEIGLLGYYSSVSQISGTVDLYTNSASVKFYPLNLFAWQSSRWDPYFTGGIAYDRFKFYGQYAGPDRAKANYSADDPHIGDIRLTNAVFGTGLEFKLVNEADFLHLFAEVKYAHNLTATSTRTALANTALAGHTMINIGISFGTHR